jgi:hypothetical protein
MDWMKEELGWDSCRFFSSPNIQTGIEVHPVSYKISTSEYFPGDKVVGV